MPYAKGSKAVRGRTLTTIQKNYYRSSNIKCSLKLGKSYNLTACLCQISIAKTQSSVRYVSKDSVPIDPVCKQPIYHPVKGDLVYVGYLAPQLKQAKGFAFFTSTVAILMQPMLYFSLIQQKVSGLFLSLYTAAISFIIFVMPCIFHLLVKNYVTYLYYNKETGEFSSTRIGFFLTKKELKFKADDVRIPLAPGVFTHVIVKGTPIYVHQPAFRSKEAYIHLMGYDKPIDLEYEHLKSKKKEN